MRRLATLAALFVTMAGSVSTQGLATGEIMKGLSENYAETVARLSLCGSGPGEAALEEHANRWAEWARPSFTSWLSGERDKFAETALRDMKLRYSVTRYGEDCPHLTAGPYKTLLGQVEQGLEDLLELPFRE